MRSGIRKWLFLLLHLTGFLILYLVVRDLQWDRFIDLLGTFPLWKYAAGLGILCLVYALKSFRWHLLNRAFGIRTTWSSSLVFYLSAGFLSVITPGRLGEFAKIYFLKRRYNTGIPQATSSVIMDRIWDVLVLSFTAGLSMVLLLPDPGWVGILLITLLFLASLGMVAAPRALFIPLLFVLKIFPGLHKKVEELYQLWRTRRTDQLLISIAITSAAFLMLAFIPVLFSKGGSYPISFEAGIGAISISNILSFIPVTVAGFGTRELVFTQVWELSNYPKEIALSVSTAYFMVTYLGSLIMGGAVYLANIKSLYRPGEIRSMGLQDPVL